MKDGPVRRVVYICPYSRAEIARGLCPWTEGWMARETNSWIDCSHQEWDGGDKVCTLPSAIALADLQADSGRRRKPSAGE